MANVNITLHVTDIKPFLATAEAAIYLLRAWGSLPDTVRTEIESFDPLFACRMADLVDAVNAWTALGAP